MKALSFYQIFLLFIFYSFAGWFCEVLYCSISKRHFVNRGFLYGPICPIYGFGGIIIFSCLMSLSHNLVLLFFASMISTTILEYFVSWVLEKLFDTKWWDYSTYRFNINGRVCLLNSVLFGVMGIVAVRFVHPLFLSVLYKIDDFWTEILALVFLGIFIVDLFFTLRSLIDFKIYLIRLELFIHGLVLKVERENWFIELHDNIEEFVKKVKDKFSDKETKENSLMVKNSEDAKKQIDEYFESILKREKSYRHFMKKFPDAKTKGLPTSMKKRKSLSKK